MGKVPFTVDVSGEFGPGEVRILWRDEPRPGHAALDALIAETWTRQLEEARRRGILLYNGQLLRLLRQRVDAGTLTLEVGPTDYAGFMGTNYLNAHRADEFGWDLFSNPIGVSATIITADGWMVYGRRSDRVACNPGDVHSFGGTIEAEERRADGEFDAFATMRRELNEELGLTPDEIGELICVGMIRDAVIRQPELIFDAHVRLNRADLDGRIDPSHPHAEHAALVACRDAPEAIEPFLTETRPIAPIAIGAIHLHGRRSFGERWYTRNLASF